MADDREARKARLDSPMCTSFDRISPAGMIRPSPPRAIADSRRIRERAVGGLDTHRLVPALESPAPCAPNRPGTRRRATPDLGSKPERERDSGRTEAGRPGLHILFRRRRTAGLRVGI